MMHWIVWITFLIFFICADAKWTLYHRTDKCDPVRIVYTLTAKNETSVVHFVVASDKHVRPPAVIVFYSTYLDSKVNVNCSAYVKNETFRGSVTVDAVTASYGVIVYELCDYEDIDDKCTIVSVDECNRYFGSNLDWEPETFDTTNPFFLSLAFRGTRMNDSHDLFLPDGGISIQFSIFDTDSQPTGEYYYKVEGGLGMAITITIDRLKVLHQRTRVAPVLLLFSNQSMEDNDDFLQLDAYPDVITDGPVKQLLSRYLMLNQRVLSSPTESDFPPGYAHLPSASWTNSIKNMNSIRLATLGPRTVFQHHGRPIKFTHSLVYAYYKNRFNPIHQGSHVGFVGIREQWINLGSPGDGYYRASNYSSWTMVLSMGTPVLKPMNTAGASHAALISFAMLALVAGVGGGGAWLYRRRKNRRDRIHPIFRYETNTYESPDGPLEQTPEATVSLRMDTHEDNDFMAERSNILHSVEPFQQRKSFLSFANRFRRGDSLSRQPLLSMERPPDYNSVVQNST